MSATLAMPDNQSTLLERINQEGFAFVGGSELRRELERTGPLHDWPAFAESWTRLEPDTYLAATGRARRRRHGVFTVRASGPPVRQPHQPHFQTLEYNRLQGDIERWFAPVEAATAANDSLRTILEFGRDRFGALAPAVPRWHVEVHQFRIEARVDRAGEPTPEGVHRDGVDYVLVLLVARENIASGTTTIHDPGGNPLGSFTLSRPFDAALVDDHRVFHGVTAVTPEDGTRDAYRDVLVVTYRAVDADSHRPAA